MGSRQRNQSPPESRRWLSAALQRPPQRFCMQTWRGRRILPPMVDLKTTANTATATPLQWRTEKQLRTTLLQWRTWRTTNSSASTTAIRRSTTAIRRSTTKRLYQQTRDGGDEQQQRRQRKSENMELQASRGTRHRQPGGGGPRAAKETEWRRVGEMMTRPPLRPTTHDAKSISEQPNRPLWANYVATWLRYWIAIDTLMD